MTGQFDVRDLHRPLDVFTRDDVYLGTILTVVPAAGPATAAATDAEPAQPDAPRPSQVSGELFGPMPTGPLGNPGPAVQSAAGGYRAASDDARVLDGGTMVVGRWWGLVGRRTIRLDQVLSLSLERVILKQTYEELDAGRTGRWSRGRGG